MTFNSDPSSLVEFLAGTVGGVASLIAGHPFDTIKTRLQSQPLVASASSPLVLDAPIYRNAMDAFRVIVKEEKFIGLYKGITSPLLGVAIMNASVFGCYSLALRAQMGPGVSIESATLGQIMIAGMASGVMTALITTPIDLLKVQQQNDVRSAASSTPSTFGLARDIVRKHGFTGLYRGYGATCIRDLGYGPYFFTYELINRTLLSMHKTDPYFPSNQELTVLNASARLSPIELAISGGIAGMVGWAVTFWADTVKTRIQAGQMPDPASSRNVVEPSGRASASAGSGSVQPNPGTSIAESSRTFRKSVISAHESDLLLGGGSRSANVQGTLPSSPTRRNINHTAPVATQGGPLLQWITTRSKFVRVSLNIYRTGGPSAFWVGIGPAMLRAIPTNAVLFIVYEATKSACMKWGL